jgi:ergothioneine biosynthesis protein EgtB
VAIEHRLMHAETLAYMLHQLPLDRKLAREQASPPVAARAVPHMIEIPAGSATLGMPFPQNRAGAERFIGGTFGWDNEFPELKIEVLGFSIDAFPVTNGEFLDFVCEGGYDHRPFWSETDWEWKVKAGIRHPQFWRRHGDSWFYRAMFAELPLPLDWPVYVSHAEAFAYARWAGKELPTEADWHRAAYGSSHDSERAYSWGSATPAPSHGNLDFARWDPVPNGRFHEGQSALGVADLVGNGWEWTSTVFAPMPGFEAFPFYPGYSANFFDGQHYVMKGGSARTAACMLRRSFRNWFQPHYQSVYAKFRCVKRNPA